MCKKTQMLIQSRDTFVLSIDLITILFIFIESLPAYSKSVKKKSHHLLNIFIYNI